MTESRVAHVGKSPAEKQAYQRMIKTQQPIDPTFEENETTPTNTVIQDEAGKSSLTPTEFKRYQPSPKIPAKEIIIGIILFIATGLIGLLAVTLNRQVGEISIEVKNQGTNINNNNEKLERIDTDLRRIDKDVEVLKEIEKRK